MRYSQLNGRAFLAGACVALLLVSTNFAEEEEEWPKEWYEPFTTASKIGLTEFSDSPVLHDGSVQHPHFQNLPSVTERLPDDPIIVYPLKETGRHGGTARLTQHDLWQFFQWEAAFTISADMRTFFPNLAEWYLLADDGLSLTIKLREGLKWSDGAPLTSHDWAFTFNDLWNNDEYSPETYKIVEGSKVVVLNDTLFRYEFPTPRPLFVNFVAQYGDFMIDPKHYMKRFHPDYTPEEELEQRIKDYEALNWTQLVNDIRREGSDDSVEVPTLRAFKLVERSSMKRKYIRNPYYPKVDPEGRQLPYIDQINMETVENAEIMAAMASTAQVDFAAFALRTQDFPLLKMGERNGAIKVHVWQRLHSSDVAIQPNYNFVDEDYEEDEFRYQKLYWDIRFRAALSHAINRDELNEIIYFGRGFPRQVTVHPSSSFYKKEWELRYLEFKPDYSRELLDEMGVVDVDGDGYREFPDGSRLTITLEFYDFETPKGITMELVQEYWRQIGIDLRLKLVDGNLQRERATAGKMQMTLWHADRVTDVLFPLFPDWWVARSISWDRGMWNDWSRWYMKSGEAGVEPPSVMRQLQNWVDQMWVTMNERERHVIGQNILATGSEYLWVIGTVGLAPHPVVVSSRLKGVPQKGIWGWDNRWTLANHPATWYIEEG